MTRLTFTFLVILCCRAPLAAQSQDGSEQDRPETAPVLVLAGPDSAAPPAPGDRPLAGKPLGERIVGGAIVGAVTGGALSAQDSDCAPSGSPAGAVAFGALWGGIRAALNWEPSDLRDPTDTEGEKGPFPFDGENCERADNN
jgi:hypothetical protein